MLSLFSTGSDTSGFRLKYMEIYNWGTFHERIFRMEPQGNNASDGTCQEGQVLQSVVGSGEER